MALDKKRILKLIDAMQAAQDEGMNFIYCKDHQSVPDAIEEKQFTATGTEADQLADDDRTQLISDWIKELQYEIE